MEFEPCPPSAKPLTLYPEVAHALRQMMLRSGCSAASPRTASLVAAIEEFKEIAWDKQKLGFEEWT